MVVVCRGALPTGVTNPAAAAVVPETVLARGCTADIGVGGGFFGVANFSALARGTNIPELSVEAVKYRIPATLPSFFP